MKVEIFTLLVSLANFILGAFIYLKNKKGSANKTFFLFSFIVSIWGLSLYLYATPVIFSALIWIKIVYLIGVFPMGFSLLYFSYNFPERSRENFQRKLLILGLFSIPLIYILFFTNLWVKRVVSERGNYETILGPFYPLIGLYGGVMIIWITINFLKKYYAAKNLVLKNQIKYILLGVFLFITTVSFIDVAIPIFFGTSTYFSLSPISSFFLIFFTAIAILKYHLFEIKTLLIELFVVIMGIILLSLPFGMPNDFLKILTIIIFLFFCVFGYILVKSTHWEIKKREEIERLAKNIEALSKMKAEFLNVVNHQLRTPVTIIKGMLSMIVEGSVKGKQSAEFIKKAYLSSERLTTILDDILVAQSLIGGTTKIELRPCSIEEIIERIINQFKILAQEKKLKIIFEKPRDPFPHTLLDPEIINRVISRLIDNAILYTEKGKINVSLSKKRGGFIQISVKDSGIGLDKDDKENLFKLFHRGDKATHLHTNGSGLGLFIIKNLTGVHKGEIEVESEGRNKGTTFILTLPLITEV